MHPKTIDNGHGERLTFVGLDGGRLLVKSSVDPAAAPPMPVHLIQTESMRVDSGRIGVEIAGQNPFYAGPGEVLTFDAGVEHRFWNAGDDELLLSGEVFPADNFEYFLTSVYGS